MAYTLYNYPIYPVLGETVYLGVGNPVALESDGYRMILTSVPDASNLSTHETLIGHQFIPDVAGVYEATALVETTTYYAPKFPGDDASTVKTLAGTKAGDIAVGHRMIFTITCLGHTLNLELVTDYDDPDTEVVYSRFVNTDLNDSIMQSYVSDATAGVKLAQFIEGTVEGEADFYIDIVDETNDLIAAFNDHCARDDIHDSADTNNVMEPENIDNLGACMNALNVLKSSLWNHEISTDYHAVTASQSNVDYIGSATDRRSAYILLSILNDRYSTHIADTDQHSSADTTNTSSLGDALSDLILHFVDYVIDRTISPSGETLDSDVTMQNIGFELSSVSNVDTEVDTAPLPS